jgi:putative transposase
MIAVDELKKHVGVSKACRALEVPRASYYRFDKPSVRTPTKTKRTHRRALSESEKAEVKTTLYSERFVDKSPYQVYATLLDEGR